MSEELERAVERIEKRRSEKRDCSVCDGYGKVQRHDPPYGQRDCGGCDATGERHVIDQPFREDLRLLLSERAELLATVERMRGGLEKIASGLPETRAVHRLSEARDIARAALTTGEANHKDKP